MVKRLTDILKMSQDEKDNIFFEILHGNGKVQSNICPDTNGTKMHHFAKSLVLSNFKDFNADRTFIFMAIVIPFWKPLAGANQMPKQWLQNK